jgi:hypothetical protein
VVTTKKLEYDTEVLLKRYSLYIPNFAADAAFFDPSNVFRDGKDLVETKRIIDDANRARTKAEAGKSSSDTGKSSSSSNADPSNTQFVDELMSVGGGANDESPKEGKGKLSPRGRKEEDSPRANKGSNSPRGSSVQQLPTPVFLASKINTNMPLFDLLCRELGPRFEQSVYKRSKHPAILDLDVLMESSVYRWTRQLVKNLFSSPGSSSRFSGKGSSSSASSAPPHKKSSKTTPEDNHHDSSSSTFEIGYSIANLYRSGHDVTEYHRDNYFAGGNRQFEPIEQATFSEERKQKRLNSNHNMTVGISFGGSRNLSFRHLQCNDAESPFLQNHGDLFAFTSPVNSNFQHAVLAERVVDQTPRVSFIFWCKIADEEIAKKLETLGRTGR